MISSRTQNLENGATKASLAAAGVGAKKPLGLKRPVLNDISNKGAAANKAAKQQTTFVKPAESRAVVGRAKAFAGGVAAAAPIPAASNVFAATRHASVAAAASELDVVHDDSMALDQHAKPLTSAAFVGGPVDAADDDLRRNDDDDDDAVDGGGEFADADLDEADDDKLASSLIAGGNGAGVGAGVNSAASIAARAAAAAVSTSVVAPPPLANVEDIDSFDGEDAQCVVEYIGEIFDYLRLKERDANEIADAAYMSRQRDLTPKMRAILVDWMVDVHIKFKLLSETMFLAVNIIDRFLSSVEVKRDKLQLVGVTAMLVASKYEEIYAPEVRDFVYISDRAFTKEEILALEIKMLNQLRFSLTPATPLHFLRRFSKAARSDATTHTLSKYLIELALPEYSLLQFSASTIAAAAVYIARAMQNITPLWNATLEHYCCLTVPQIKECAIELNKALLNCWSPAATLKATKRKYSSPKLLDVGRLPPLEQLPF